MIGKISQFIFLINLLFGVSCDVGLNRSINSDNGYEFLQVPSPEWADQILYFIVTDRFMDGDSTNNDQGTGEYKKGDGGFWNGGDIKGITQKIDYLQELGVTGIWITPPVANQWRNPQHTGTGNHGYWAIRFDQVDKHLGDLEDYKILSATLHSKGMYLIQDVVVNHFGDFYTYYGPYDSEDVSKNFKLHDVEQPRQYPFNHNDARKEVDRALGIYHFAPSFTDHSDTIQKTQFQYADLDDLNTSNPVVRDALRKNFGYWIEEVGVDGFRFDTPHMVEHDFWHSFLHDKEGDHLGIDLLAKQLGKEHFLTAGEVAFFPKPFDHSGTKEARKYLGTKIKPEMNSILNFPLNTAINRVFIEKKPTSTLSFRIKSIQENFQRADQLLNFIDNHDAPRLLSKSDRKTMRQALLFIMTIPGVPVIYYGTEQELTGMRQTMFKGGVGSIDKDHFDTENAYFKFIQGLINLRKSNEVFRRGKLKILRDNSYGPGLFIYEMKLGDVSALILINTSESRSLIDGLSLPTFSPGNYVSKYSIGVGKEILSVSNDRIIDMILDAKSAQVYLNTGDNSQTKFDLHGTIELNNDFSEILNVPVIQLSGKAKGVENIGLVIDGEYEYFLPITNKNQNSWFYDLSLSNLVNGKHRITAIGYDEKGSLITSSKYFTLALPTKHLLHYEDEIQDDHGPNGKYTYPSHSSFGHQQDIKAVDVSLTGNNLTLDITMSEITQIWIPPNGFDHVLLNIYIDMPDKKAGVKSLPFQNAFFPNQGVWDYRFSLGGFGIEAFESHPVSGPEKLGKSIITPFANVNYGQNKISVTLPAKMLGNPSTLKNANLYINTWGGSATNPRTIDKMRTTWTYGGGDSNSPKIMDDTKIITLE